MKNLKLFIGLVLLGLYSCSEMSNSNTLDSDNYNTKEERVAVLKKEIRVFSTFNNAEFELFNVNGFSNHRTAVPGASSWNYKFAITVNPSDINKWTEGMNRIHADGHNDDWIKKLVQKRANDWKTNSEPEWYTRNGDDVLLVVYRPEGILFKSIVNL